MDVVRISAPKFKVSFNRRLILNEYELRHLLLEVAKGERESGFSVYELGHPLRVAQVEPDGRLTCNLHGLAISGTLSMELIKLRRKIQKGES